MVNLFLQLISYQTRSICSYHRSPAATIYRDAFKIDDWAGQLSRIKEAEKLVESDMKQYNAEEIKTQLRKLADAASAAEKSLGSIHAATRDQTQWQAKTHEDDKDKQCLQDLYVTDPRIVKKEVGKKRVDC